MYNTTCLITGKKENLRMHPLRDSNNNMIGWIFINESIKIEDIEATVEWKFKVKITENCNT